MTQSLPPDLEQLLLRGDIWRGTKAYVQGDYGQDTGHPLLNSCLVHQGWPHGCLIEISQQEFGQGEWLLLTPSLCKSTQGLQILINPPALPFAQGLLQAGLNLDRLLIINAPAKNDFLAAFVEIARAKACSHLLAWQPQQALNYTDVRKCVLASSEGSGLYWLLRPARVSTQHSPAHLRLHTRMSADTLEVTITKQKGGEQSLLNRPISLPLPRAWLGYQPHAHLDTTPDSRPATTPATTLKKTAKKSTDKNTTKITHLRSR